MAAWDTPRPTGPAWRTRRAFWGRGRRRRSTGSAAAARCSTTATRRSTAGSPTASLNTCYNALDRHVVAGRADQLALIHDSPVTGTQTPAAPTPSCSSWSRAFAGVLRDLGVEQGRPGRHLPADDPGGRRRDAGLRAHRRRALRGVRWLRAGRARGADRRCPARSCCHRLVRDRGRTRGRVQAARRRGARAGEHQPAYSLCCNGRRPEAGDGASRDLDWADVMTPGRQPAECVAVRPPTRSTCSTRAARPASPRASSATTAAMPSRCAGRCPIYDARPGEVWWTACDVGWVVGHSYIVYAPLLTGCTTVLYEGKPVGTPMPARSGGSSAEHGVNRSVHGADRDPGDQEGGPGGRAAGGPTFPPCARCSSPASGWTRTPITGRASGSASRSSTTGGRPRPGGRSRRTCAGWSRCRSRRARRRCRCRASTCRCSTSGASRSGRGRGCDLPRLPMPPGTLPTLCHQSETTHSEKPTFASRGPVPRTRQKSRSALQFQKVARPAP